MTLPVDHLELTQPPLEVIANEELDAVIQNFGKEALIPGTSLTVHRHSTPTSSAATIFRSYGVAYGDTPVESDMRFPICSMTKHIIALALLRLLYANGMTEDTLVKDVLPKFRLSNEVEGPVVTFAYILGHTTGVETYNAGWTEMEATGVSFFEYLAKLPAVSQPGLKWSYSNIMFDVCVVAIEALSGEDIETYLKSIFFGPLGMEATSYRGEGGKDVSEGHILSRVCKENGDCKNEMSNLPFGAGCGLQATSSKIAWKGGAGLISSAQDMAKWMAYLPIDPFFHTITKPRILAPIRSTDSILDQNEQYGLGMFIGTFRGVPYLQHLAGIAGFGGLVTYLPTYGLSIVSYNNSDQAQELDSLIAAIIISRLVGQETDSVVASLRKERETRQRSALYDTSPVRGQVPTPATDLSGAYIGAGIGRLIFTPDSNVEIRPRCDTTVWICWQHGGVRPIVTYLGEGKYAGCLEYRQWGRDSASEGEVSVRYTYPFRLERREDGSLWASEFYDSSPFLLRPE